MVRQLVRDMSTSLRFTGSADNCVAFGAAAPLALSTSSVAFYIKPTRSGSSYTIYCTNFTAASGYEIRLSGSNNIQLLKNGVTVLLNTASKQLRHGDWLHVVITFNAPTGVSVVYVNGAAFDGATAGVTTFTHDDVVIGKKTGDFVGYLDDFKVFNRVLTPTEAADLYNNPRTVTSGLVLSCGFDEGSGTSVTDSSASALTGTITGATYSTDVAIKPRAAA